MIGRKTCVAYAAFVGLVAACSQGVSEQETTPKTRVQGITGGNTRDVSLSTAMPYRGVGQLTITKVDGTKGGCSGSVFERDRVLAAAHCFCSAVGVQNNVSFALPTPSGVVTINSVGTPALHYADWPALCSSGFTLAGDSSASAHDLAVVFLARPFTTAELPSTLPVYTQSDITDYINSYAQGVATLYQGPFEITGFAPNSATPPIRQSGAFASAYLFRDCKLTGGACSDELFWSSWNISVSAHSDKGDSGGPVTFLRSGTTPTTFAVMSSQFMPAVGSNSDYYAPTFDTQHGAAGAWLRQYIKDDDRDGINDANDNCSPAKAPQCIARPWLCYNPDQLDTDGDTIGDACDNCAPATCTALGLSVAACSNASQEDTDRDFLGDVCDLCPGKAGSNVDFDNDLVGDACDNCSSVPNGPKRCLSASDCGGGTQCLSVGSFGSCSTPVVPGSVNNFAACINDSQCPGGACNRTVTYGRCAAQLDDADGDGMGLACDLCSNTANAGVEANSNDRAELAKPAAAVPDSCDPVPVFVSRPLLGGFVSGLPSFASKNAYTTFLSTAGLGTEVGGATSTTANVGFRHCSCKGTDGLALNKDECMSMQCPVVVSEFAISNRWKAITIGASGGLIPAVNGAVDQRLLARTFTRTIDCTDVFPHLELGERCRVGSAPEVVTWFSGQDVGTRVEALATPSGGVGSAGVFWSHVVDGAYASIRDSSTGGALRENFEYVTTPLVRPPQPPLNVRPLPCTYGNGCMLVWRPDWAGYPFPTRDFSDPPPFTLVPGLARILLSDLGAKVAVGSSTQPSVDVSAVVTQVAALLDRSDLSWLTPSEPGTRVNRLTSAVPYVALPTPWRRASVRPTGVKVTNGSLKLMPVATRPAGTPVFLPPDRDKHGAFYSAAERRVVMVGGHDPASGGFFGEAWSYSLDTDIWSRLFVTKPIPVFADVAAVAYNSASKVFAVLDTRPDVPNGLTYDRIMVVDMTTETAITVRNAKDTGRYSRYGLVADADGTWVLTAQPRTGTTFDAFRFRVAGGTITWLGTAHVSGVLIDAPLRIPNGLSTAIFVPVLRDPAQEFVALTPAMFTSDPAGIQF